eukprot:m.103276 g.103276  ORF g.103276 m.103276 type:complete len:548 (-) comp27487_c0_seq1:126-1769(-)
MSTSTMLLFLFLTTCSAVASSVAQGDAFTEATVHYSDSEGFTVVAGIDKSGLAYGRLDNGTKEGWSVLNIVANPQADGNDTLAMQAAGNLESYLTCWHIAEFSQNNDDIKSVNDKRINDFTTTSHEWTQMMANSNQSDYWIAVKNVLAQFEGIVDGYAKFCSEKPGYKALTKQEMLFMQMDGDLGDLQSAFGGEIVRNRQTQQQQLRDTFANTSETTTDRNGLRCTMLAKLAPDNSELWFGHATWDTFANMAPRIYKSYTLPVKRNGVMETHTTSFSSSPSWLSSIDDWYVVNGTSSMAIIETSHDINNQQIYSKLSPTTVSSWIRVIVANMLATDGATWGEVFSYAHSGTYNNEWQIIDMHKFSPGAAPSNGLLTIVEEVPGLIQTEDVTSILMKDLFWPSFNIPFLPDIQKAAGYNKQDWESDQRHCLLTQLHKTVTSIDTMEKVMRHNDYKHDSCSQRNPCGGAIACRADLAGVGGQAFGALDAKWASWTSVVKGGQNTYAQMGPTHDQQPIFCWSPMTVKPHHGHPKCFNYSTVEIAPIMFTN